ncbi:sigma-70 family RNA polymerase sigma factor [Nocardioides deserti]|nr:sigma-70 family RNA polymerase sigma factor [Nocardioides deserti]GGO79198.1 hypothetical protein GCM10012276_38390 [Nocardioides deserti]
MSIAPLATDDARLIARARERDDEATAELFERHHAAAYRYARVLSDAATADDLVSEAFAKVLQRLHDGGGPDQALRPYLLATVRNCHVDHVRRNRRLVPVDDQDLPGEPPATQAFGAGSPEVPGSSSAAESAVVLEALRSLPERWQLVLWHTAVEAEDHQTVGQLLGIKANAVAALASRAREGLRRAYLAAHVSGADDAVCRATREQLPSLVRGRLGVRHTAAVEQHLEGCLDCETCRRELVLLNNRVGALLAPAVLGATGTTYLGASGGAGGAGGDGPDGPDLDRVDHAARWTRRTKRRAAAVVAAAAVAVTAGAVLALQSGPGPDRAVAEPAPLPPSESAAPAPSATPSEVPSENPTASPSRRGPSAAPRTAPAVAPAVPAAPFAPVAPPAAPGSPAPPAAPAPSTPPSQPNQPEPPSAPPSTPPSTPPTAPSQPLPPGWTAEDLQLAGGYAADFGSHLHLELPVRSSSPDAVLTVSLTGARLRSVHSDGSYLRVPCAEDRADPSVVRCSIGAADGPVGIDVIATGGAFRGTATLSAVRNRDPVPANDRVVLTLR